MAVRVSSSGVFMEGGFAAGRVPILTAGGGVRDSGQNLVSTVDPGTAWSNNSASAAAPLANTRMVLGNGSANAPTYSGQSSPTSGVYFPQADYVAVSAGGNRMLQARSSSLSIYAELIMSGRPILRAQGSTDCDFTIAGNGKGAVFLANNAGAGNSVLFRADGPATAGNPSNYLRVLVGDGTGKGPTLTPLAQGTGDTNIDINLQPAGTGIVKATSFLHALSGNSIVAGVATQAFVKASSTPDLGLYYGTGDPSFSAAKASLYVKTDATTAATRLWINTNGTTGWASFTASA